MKNQISFTQKLNSVNAVWVGMSHLSPRVSDYGQPLWGVWIKLPR